MFKDDNYYYGIIKNVPLCVEKNVSTGGFNKEIIIETTKKISSVITMS